MTDVARDERGRLLSGKSLNPLGRPKAPPGAPARLKRALLHELDDEKMRELLRVHIERGIAGSVSSARLILEYAVGKPRERIDVDVTARGALWQFILDARGEEPEPEPPR